MLGVVFSWVANEKHHFLYVANYVEHVYLPPLPGVACHKEEASSLASYYWYI